MFDTPRTDALEARNMSEVRVGTERGFFEQWAAHSRQLERELEEARAWNASGYMRASLEYERESNEVLKDQRDRYAANAGRLAEVVQAFIDETVSFMTLNNLGDPEEQHNVKWGRAVLADAWPIGAVYIGVGHMSALPNKAKGKQMNKPTTIQIPSHQYTAIVECLEKALESRFNPGASDDSWITKAESLLKIMPTIRHSQVSDPKSFEPNDGAVG